MYEKGNVSIREGKKIPRMLHSPSHFVLFKHTSYNFDSFTSVFGSTAQLQLFKLNRLFHQKFSSTSTLILTKSGNSLTFEVLINNAFYSLTSRTRIDAVQ